LDVLGDGGGGWLKSVSLAQKLIIIESARAHSRLVSNIDVVPDYSDIVSQFRRNGCEVQRAQRVCDGVCRSPVHQPTVLGMRFDCTENLG
jgi:hypothetical protein